jgi:hypothetical protein
VDDGSAVVEAQVKHVEVTSVNDPKADQKANEEDKSRLSNQPSTRIPEVGEIVKVIGKLGFGRDDETRVIRVDFLGTYSYRCMSVKVFLTEAEMATPQEEAGHWRQTVQLHQSKYSVPFQLPDVSHIEIPFTPPKECIGIPEEPTPRPAQTTPVKQQPTVSSPASVRSRSSAISRFEDSRKSLPRLRHPSRLRSSELTLLTFRLYIKYFIDYMHKRRILSASNDPTKYSERRTRGRVMSPTSNITNTSLDGFGLSYLRRVPDLRELAVRVVKAEQRLKEKRRLQQEKENLYKSDLANASNLTSNTKPPRKKKPDNLKRYTKLLFSQALLTLYQDGLLVPHDGAGRRWTEREVELMDNCHLWRSKDGEDSKDTTRVDGSTVLGQPSVSHVTAQDEMEISDHDEDEESFVPVTTELLSEPVFSAIQLATSQRRKDEVGKKSIKSRGAFEEDIIKELHNLDSRWDRIYDIKPTLRHLEEIDKIWEVREGCWAIL